MNTEVPRLMPSDRAATPAQIDEIMERIRPEFVFVDPRQAPIYHQKSLESGESRLALAILEDALRCAVRHFHSALPTQRQEAAEALEWIESDEQHYWLAFEPICQRFELDPDWIRLQVARQMHAANDRSAPRAA